MSNQNFVTECCPFNHPFVQTRVDYCLEENQQLSQILPGLATAGEPWMETRMFFTGTRELRSFPCRIFRVHDIKASRKSIHLFR